jgi:hypothetical protein
MKLGMYTMAPEPISMSYFISLCVYMCVPVSLLGQRLGRKLPPQRLQTQ